MIQMTLILGGCPAISAAVRLPPHLPLPRWSPAAIAHQPSYLPLTLQTNEVPHSRSLAARYPKIVGVPIMSYEYC